MGSGNDGEIVGDEIDLMERATKRPYRFSIRNLLKWVAYAAIALTLWRSFFYEPPTHKIAEYERASPYSGIAAKIGPNLVSIASVARNDRSGGLKIEDGRGGHLTATVPNSKNLKSCGPWLDVAQFALQPDDDRLEITNVRVFDHEAREFISFKNNRYGWRILKSNIVQLYGLGKELPDRVDLWLRCQSRAANQPVAKLLPAKGESTRLGNLSFHIKDIQAGYQGWSIRTGFAPVKAQYAMNSAVDIRCNQSPTDEPLQVSAVLKDGRRLNEPHRCYFYDGLEVIECLSKLNQISHFEIRPHAGDYRFFFEGVRLPRLSKRQKTFVNPPKFGIAVSGGEIEKQRIEEFRPLDVRFEISDGNPYSSVKAGPRGAVLLPNPNGPSNRGSVFTINLEVRGLARLPMTTRFRLTNEMTWRDASKTRLFNSSPLLESSLGVETSTQLHPLVDVAEIEVELKAISK